MVINGSGLIREVAFDESGLIREVVFGGSGLIRDVAFGGSGLIKEVACLEGNNLVLFYYLSASGFFGVFFFAL